MQWATDRILFGFRLTKSARALLLLPMFALSLLRFWRDEAPTDRQPPRILTAASGWLPWWGWVIAGLVLLLLALFETAYRGNSRLAPVGDRKFVGDTLADYLIDLKRLETRIVDDHDAVVGLAQLQEEVRVLWQRIMEFVQSNISKAKAVAVHEQEFGAFNVVYTDPKPRLEYTKLLNDLRRCQMKLQTLLNEY